MGLKNSVVVITGASSGIGRASALLFARRGARLVLAARGRAALDSLVEECRSLGAEAVAVPTDVSDAEAVDRLATRAITEFHRIDVWVNNAGISSFATLADSPLDDIRRVLDVNIMGVVHGTRAALRVMKRQERGVIIDVASLLGEVPQPYTAAYSASKAAVRSIAASVRSELALEGHRRIHVSTVLPATVDTPFFWHAANRTGRPALAMPPVYSPQRVAKAIVGAAENPEPEIVVGKLGRLMKAQHRITPRVVDGLLAAETERLQLGPDAHIPSTDGAIFRPGDDPRDPAVEGGWHGRSRSGGRRVLGLLLLAGLGVGAWRWSRDL